MEPIFGSTVTVLRTTIGAAGQERSRASALARRARDKPRLLHPRISADKSLCPHHRLNTTIRAAHVRAQLVVDQTRPVRRISSGSTRMKAVVVMDTLNRRAWVVARRPARARAVVRPRLSWRPRLRLRDSRAHSKARSCRGSDRWIWRDGCARKERGTILGNLVTSHSREQTLSCCATHR